MQRMDLPEILQSIPQGMRTNETWMLYGRKAVPGMKPAAYFCPDDYQPEYVSAQNGIPLYRQDQTKEYLPRPETIASQQYFNFFLDGQNRHRHSQWDDGIRDWGPHAKPG